jgi:WD40 repeat protein
LSPPVRKIRVFISSPGDVAEERERAKQVVDGLQRRYSGAAVLETVLWEDMPLQADLSFQEGIDILVSEERGVDVAVFILWSRLGSPLGNQILKDDGSQYLSGTEREFDVMMEARRRTGGDRPAILVYTRTDESSFEERMRGQSTQVKRSLLDQKELVERFIQEEFHDQEAGFNLRAYHSYDRPTTFSQRLRTHLSTVIDDLLGDTGAAILWDVDTQGPPFLGLSAFQPEHADVYFGREDEVLEARHKLRESARDGLAFLLLAGASGSGKSSLARAGLVPAISEGELDEDVRAWRVVVACPSELGEDPLLGLVARLGAPDVLPELLGETTTPEELAADLARDPEQTTRRWVREAFARASQAAGGGVRVMLVLDQLEEIFASVGVTPEQRGAFLAAVEALARGGNVWVAATARSDFLGQLNEDPALARLCSEGGLLMLRPPEADGLYRIVTEPARMAGLRFEERDERDLADRIVRDATAHAEALPLVEYVLRELFERRDDSGQMTWAAYEELGGVEGALARRAEQVLAAQPAEIQAALGRALEALVTLGQDDAGGGADRVVRQAVPLADLAGDEPVAALVEAMIDERLLTASDDPARGGAVVRVAHESLLRVWPRAVAWVEENRDFLRTRARVEARFHEGSPLLEGDPLLDAARLHLARAPSAFGAELRGFVERSVEAALAETRRREAVRRRFVQGLAGLALVATVAGGWAVVQKSRADDLALQARQSAERALDEATAAREARDAADRSAAEARELSVRMREERDRARVQEGYAWLERGRSWGDGRGQSFPAALLAARALGVPAREGVEASDLATAYPPLLTRESAPGAWTEARGVIRHALQGPGVLLPAWAPAAPEYVAAAGVSALAWSQDGRWLAWAPYRGSMDRVVLVQDAASEQVRAKIAPEAHVGAVTALAFSPDGETLLTGGQGGTIWTWALATGEAIRDFGGHGGAVTSIEFDPGGELVSSRDHGGTILTWHAATGRVEARRAVADRGREARGQVLSPGGRWMAEPEPGGVVRVRDLSTDRERITLRGSAGRAWQLAFSPDEEFLAIGRTRGVLERWDLRTGEKLAPREDEVGRAQAVAYSPDGASLAIGGADGVIRIWDLESGRLRSALRGIGEVNALAYSPDGARLLAAETAQDFRLRTWDVTSGQVRPEADRSLRQQTWAIAFSPDGRRYAAAFVDGGVDRPAGEVQVWDSRTHRTTAVWKAHEGAATALAFAPDGASLLTGGTDRKIIRWDLTGKRLATLGELDGPVTSVCVDPALNRVAAATVSRSGAFLHGGESEDEEGWSHLGASEEEGGTSDVAFTPRGDLLVLASRKGRLRTIDVASGLSRDVFTGMEGRVRLALSPDGRRVAAVGSRRGIRLLDLSPANRSRELRGASPTGSAAAVSSDGTMVALASRELGVELIDPASGRRLTMLRAEPSEAELLRLRESNPGAPTPVVGATAVAFLPASKALVAGTRIENIRVWDLEKPRAPRLLLEPSRSFHGELAVSSDGRFVVAGLGPALLRAWEVSRAWAATDISLEPTEAGRLGSFPTATFSEDGRVLGLALQDPARSASARVQLRSAGTWEVRGQWEIPPTSIRSLALSPDGSQWAAVAEGDDSSRVWLGGAAGEARSVEVPVSARRYKSVWALAFSPDGRMLACGYRSGLVVLVDAGTEEVVLVEEVLAQPVGSLAFAGDGRELVVEGFDGRPRILDLRGLEGPSALDELPGHLLATAQALGATVERTGVTVFTRPREPGSGEPLRPRSFRRGRVPGPPSVHELVVAGDLRAAAAQLDPGDHDGLAMVVTSTLVTLADALEEGWDPLPRENGWSRLAPRVDAATLARPSVRMAVARFEVAAAGKDAAWVKAARAALRAARQR